MNEQVDPRARLDEIKARADAATEGPWLYADDGPRNILYHQQSQRDGSYIGSLSLAGVSTSDEDATFIAHARTDLPAMAAALMDALDVENEPMPSGSEGDDWYRAGWQDAMFNVKARITDALGGDRG